MTNQTNSTSSEPVAWINLYRRYDGKTIPSPLHPSKEAAENGATGMEFDTIIVKLPNPTLSADEVQRIIGVLAVLATLHPVLIGKVAGDEINAAIALLEKIKP